MLKIYGRRNSGNVQKVLWCADEIGLTYEQIDRGGTFGGNKEPAFLAMNPNGVVPVIDDDGFILWESNAIVRYLAAKHSAGTLSPADPARRADGDRWMDWATTTLVIPVNQVFAGWVRTPPEKRDPVAIEAARLKAEAAWRIADARLARTAWLGGDTFTMGDIPVGVFAYRWFNLTIERSPLPNLQRYYEALTKRPAYQKHIMLPLS